ncbi:MAG: class I SAM-dependent methyltransferase, partial [Candidatus Fibromonas sp.]|jgi:23S rRNA (cytosine1962-C5)-methyltransferase|nr:class I SAM-dependent methyltransferase [Candidatus Fibromonas sp.]
MSRLILSPTREKSLLRLHPWIFSGAVGEVIDNPKIGETVKVLDSKGNFLAHAAYSPNSQIRARVWSFDDNEKIDKNFLAQRLRRCLESRRAMGFEPNAANAFRFANAENDFLPGCIIDCYAGYLSVQLLSAGWENFRAVLVECLTEIFPDCKGIIERSDSEVRIKEGLETQIKILAGDVPREAIIIEENGLKILVDLRKGHKTGYYLDQRNARKRIGELAKDKRVLNCFCYTGGFGLFAARGGAKSVRQVDASASALELAEQNAALNNLSSIDYVEADVFTYLRKCRDKGETFDLLILDPPKFAESSSQVEKAAKGYKDINLLAIKLLAPGGMLATFSCSGHISPELFQKIVADAAVDAKRPVQILENFRQAPDHPVLSSFPEGMYLKGLLAVV